MSKKLCMISGKGGCGKTSLAFSFAKTLIKLNLKVLLIDCDMSTHGATFFVKQYVDECKATKKKILSVDDILNSESIPVYGFTDVDKNTHNGEKTELNNIISMEDNLYFIPSDVSISKDQKCQYRYSTFKDFISQEIEEQVDIIIFDCQAGYSDLTRHVITLSDTCLLLSEPDAVSAAANKALCFQLGAELENVQTFQIFNKISEEEKKYYSKVATSAFFTNLQPILFNWKVRKVFALRQIPSIESVDLDFGKDIISILISIFPEYKKQLNEYKNNLFKEFREIIETRIADVSEYRKSSTRSKLIRKILSMSSMVCVLCVLIFLIINTYVVGDKFESTPLALITIIVSLLNVVMEFIFNDSSIGINRRLEEQDFEIEKLKETLSEYSVDID